MQVEISKLNYELKLFLSFKKCGTGKKEERHRPSKRQNDYAIRAVPILRARFTLTQWNCARSFVGIFSLLSFHFEWRLRLWEKLTKLAVCVCVVSVRARAR